MQRFLISIIIVMFASLMFYAPSAKANPVPKRAEVIQTISYDYHSYPMHYRHHRHHHRHKAPLRLRLIRWARTQEGKPYYYGGTGPDSYDCSGLVYAAYHHVTGRWGPRDTTEMLGAVGSFMEPVRHPQKGDLAFFGSGHVEIWLNGGWSSGWTFGAHDWGTVVSRAHYEAAWGWAPTAIFRVMWPHHRRR